MENTVTITLSRDQAKKLLCVVEERAEEIEIELEKHRAGKPRFVAVGCDPERSDCYDALYSALRLCHLLRGVIYGEPAR